MLKYRGSLPSIHSGVLYLGIHDRLVKILNIQRLAYENVIQEQPPI